MRNENSATERQVERSIRSVRHACSAALPGIARPVLLGPVGVAHGHADHHDRVDHRRRRGHARDTPARPHDDRSAHALPQNAIGAADVARRLRRDGGRLEAQARFAHGGGSLADDLVGGGPPVPEGQVEPEQFEIEPEHSGVEHPQRLVEQFLPGLVTVTDDDLAAR